MKKTIQALLYLAIAFTSTLQAAVLDVQSDENEIFILTDSQEIKRYSIKSNEFLDSIDINFNAGKILINSSQVFLMDYSGIFSSNKNKITYFNLENPGNVSTFEESFGVDGFQVIEDRLYTYGSGSIIHVRDTNDLSLVREIDILDHNTTTSALLNGDSDDEYPVFISKNGYVYTSGRDHNYFKSYIIKDETINIRGWFHNHYMKNDTFLEFNNKFLISSAGDVFSESGLRNVLDLGWSRDKALFLDDHYALLSSDEISIYNKYNQLSHKLSTGGKSTRMVVRGNDIYVVNENAEVEKITVSDDLLVDEKQFRKIKCGYKDSIEQFNGYLYYYCDSAASFLKIDPASSEVVDFIYLDKYYEFNFNLSGGYDLVSYDGDVGFLDLKKEKVNHLFNLENAVDLTRFILGIGENVVIFSNGNMKLYNRQGKELDSEQGHWAAYDQFNEIIYVSARGSSLTYQVSVSKDEKFVTEYNDHGLDGVANGISFSEDGIYALNSKGSLFKNRKYSKAINSSRNDTVYSARWLYKKLLVIMTQYNEQKRDYESKFISFDVDGSKIEEIIFSEDENFYAILQSNEAGKAYLTYKDKDNNLNVRSFYYQDEDFDKDGVVNSLDSHPADSNEWSDNDKDNVGDNADKDDDNDGYNDSYDDFPFDPNEHLDSDKDGVGNNQDTDDDNDGVEDELDELPLDPSETKDNDKDGIGDNRDPDDDNDGVVDSLDEFPFDASESLDSDGDGLGNNIDLDDDNDGIRDSSDFYPLDPLKTDVKGEDFLPLNPGSEWNFKHYDHVTAKVGSPFKLNGYTVTPLIFDSGYELYFSKAGNKLLFHGLRTADTYDEGKAKYAKALLDTPIDLTEKRSNYGTGSFFISDFGNDTMEWEASVVTKPVSSMTSYSGNREFQAFQSIVKLRFNRDIDGYRYVVPYNLDFSFSENIGIVQIIDNDRTFKLDDFEITDTKEVTSVSSSGGGGGGSLNWLLLASLLSMIGLRRRFYH